MNDHQRGLAYWVHLSLSIGVSSSAIVMTVGLVLSLATGKHAPTGVPPEWSQLIAGSLHGDAVSLLQAGLLLLMLTPIVRVLVLCLGWLAEKEFRFAAVALVVFSLLLGSLFLGIV